MSRCLSDHRKDKHTIEQNKKETKNDKMRIESIKCQNKYFNAVIVVVTLQKGLYDACLFDHD